MHALNDSATFRYCVSTGTSSKTTVRWQRAVLGFLADAAQARLIAILPVFKGAQRDLRTSWDLPLRGCRQEDHSKHEDD